MGAPRKFDEETRARALRMYFDKVGEPGESKLGARRHVGELLDVAPATLRAWIEAKEHANGVVKDRGSGEVIDVEEVRGLRKENAELRRANKIRETASAFFALAELDPLPRSLG